MAKLRLIQAGMGGMGRAWWHAVVPESPDFELVAIVDVAEAPLHEAGERLGLPRERRFSALQPALDAVEADAVLTVTPPPVHLEHARLALPRGLHLLTEKPIAHDWAGAIEMVELAKKAGRQLVVAQNYRYSATMQAMKRAFAEQSLGDFGHGHIDFYIPADFPGTFRETMQFPLLVDMAIHHLDLVRFITGRNIVRVLAHSFRPNWSWFEHEPGLKMLLELEGGLPFSYSGDWTASGRCTSWNGDWRLQFSNGSLHLNNDKLSIARCEKWMKNPTTQPLEIPPAVRNGQAEVLARFAESIRTGIPAETSGADNLQSFAAVMRAVESARVGQWLDVSAVGSG